MQGLRHVDSPRLYCPYRAIDILALEPRALPSATVLKAFQAIGCRGIPLLAGVVKSGPASPMLATLIIFEFVLPLQGNGHLWNRHRGRCPRLRCYKAFQAVGNLKPQARTPAPQRSRFRPLACTFISIPKHGNVFSLKGWNTVAGGIAPGPRPTISPCPVRAAQFVLQSQR